MKKFMNDMNILYFDAYNNRCQQRYTKKILKKFEKVLDMAFGRVYALQVSEFEQIFADMR